MRKLSQEKLAKLPNATHLHLTCTAEPGFQLSCDLDLGNCVYLYVSLSMDL